MSTKIYFKETVWREVVVDLSDQQKEEVYAGITSGSIQNSDDLYDFFYEKKISPIDNSFDYETSEPMSKEENGDQPTIEVYERNKNFPYYDNPTLTN